ncbi:sulfatase-like hydrolase/transferase [Labilibaculum antarcticum]|uniref:Acetylglucosamine-6-sulfatase n=1 Tax=Labilibaculum antarcticum TaxID=1717717 RepID=A0A1Y1CDM2_9BACT|nr:sulfatase-like hydrolase/transferase [Labilibaculum antarcticum]BAX78446.1 acetylglucosamine-6-sulfatase [Labilibaculum antarcticum]
MRNKIILSLALALATLVNVNAKSVKKGTKPNVIFILTDDQQFDLLGCNGNEIIKTPQFDKMAEQGVRFTNAHVTSAICTPSRVSMFLSQFERKHGVNFNSGTSVSPEAWKESYPVVMKDNGYYTGYIGKNHSPIGEGGYQSGLIDKSFDYWYAGHGHLSFYPKKRHEIFKGAKHDTQVEIMTEGVADFLNSNEYRLDGAFHFLDSRPEDQPFCLSICFNLPHGASTGTMKQLATDSIIYRELYRNIPIPVEPNYIAKKDIVTPKLPADLLRADDRQQGYDYVDNIEDNKERLIRQMQAMTGIDGLLGKLRAGLKEQGLDKNTVIIYTSDHGLFMGQQGLGGKALCYEQCTHVPMIVYNPMTSSKVRGRVVDELVQTIDIAPTILTYAGVEIPKSYQGKNISGIVDASAEKVRDYLFTENLWSTQFGNPRCESVQDKEWKYIRYYKNENLSARVKIETAKELGINVNTMLYSVHDPDIALYRSFVEGPLRGEKAVYEELYNLKKDPQEMNNLINDSSKKQIVENLRTQWKSLLKEARGEGKPKVLRYTADSMLEDYGVVKHE